VVGDGEFVEEGMRDECGVKSESHLIQISKRSPLRQVHTWHSHGGRNHLIAMQYICSLSYEHEHVVIGRT
jgi:hypothetical protein